MGISMTLFIASDAELARFQTDTVALNRTLAGGDPHTERPSCYLSSYWRSLHRILTHQEKEETLPLAALTVGELRYPKAEEGAHALRSDTVRRLAKALDAFGKPEVR